MRDAHIEMEPHDQLIETRQFIEEAFPRCVLKRPGDIVAGAEQEDALYFLGRDWHEVDPSVFRTDPQCLFFLTPRAMHCYMPAFLMFLLDAGQEGVELQFTDVLLTSLQVSGADYNGWASRQKEMFSLFSAKQRRAVCMFVEFWHATYGTEFEDVDFAGLKADWHCGKVD